MDFAFRFVSEYANLLIVVSEMKLQFIDFA